MYQLFRALQRQGGDSSFCSERRWESSFPHLACFCSLSPKGWTFRDLTQGCWSARVTAWYHASISLVPEYYSHKLITFLKSLLRWKHLHPWHHDLPPGSWGTSRFCSSCSQSFGQLCPSIGGLLECMCQHRNPSRFPPQPGHCSGQSLFLFQ